VLPNLLLLLHAAGVPDAVLSQTFVNLSADAIAETTI
jgi:hypothetical protein